MIRYEGPADEPEPIWLGVFLKIDGLHKPKEAQAPQPCYVQTEDFRVTTASPKLLDESGHGLPEIKLAVGGITVPCKLVNSRASESSAKALRDSPRFPKVPRKVSQGSPKGSPTFPERFPEVPQGPSRLPKAPQRLTCF
jgi:hypothetical protein